jgi:hypothetical protein
MGLERVLAYVRRCRQLAVAQSTRQQRDHVSLRPLEQLTSAALSCGAISPSP